MQLAGLSQAIDLLKCCVLELQIVCCVVLISQRCNYCNFAFVLLQRREERRKLEEQRQKEEEEAAAAKKKRAASEVRHITCCSAYCCT
jgi:hypothetical protein